MRSGSTDAEMAVIGCMIQTQNQGEILEEVSAEDFSHPDLGALFQKLADMWQRHGRVDSVMAASLPERDLVLQCAAAPVSYSAYLSYCRTVRTAATIARVQGLGLRLAASDLTSEQANILAEQLNAVLAGRRGVKCETAMQGMIGFIRRQSGEAPQYIRTGFSRLDKWTCFSPGDMVVIGARPSNGKTAFSINMALNMARKGKRVVFYSLETSAEKINDRGICCWYDLDFGEVKACATDFPKPDYDPDEYATLPFEVVEASGRTVQWIKTDAIRRKADVVMVDYLGLIHGKGASRYEIVTQISQDLHAAAQETKMLFIVLSQLNRQGAGGEPNIQDLRESGQIEQDADCIILLHYADRETGEFVVRVAKNKEGEVGPMKFVFRAEHQNFREVENR